MTDHVHLVLRPHSAPSLAQLMRMVQMRYSQYRHAVEGGNGHLWQSRYYSCAVEPQRLGAAMRYVEAQSGRNQLLLELAGFSHRNLCRNVSIRLSVWIHRLCSSDSCTSSGNTISS